MTVNYSDSLLKFLFRWDGSVWKAIFKEFFVWLIMFYTVRFIFAYALPDVVLMKDLVKTFNGYMVDMPIDFILVFYVAQVVARWWSQVLIVPWPDETINLFAAFVNGVDDSSRLLRYTLGRYMVLTQCLALRQISDRVRGRLPTMKHVVASNLMTSMEYAAFKDAPPQMRWQLPLLWAQSIVVEDALDCSGQKLSPPVQTAIIQELNKYRSSLRTLFTYNWINMPLLYTQATGIGVYGYFAICLIGEQHTYQNVDIPFPINPALEFVFYVGWYKVALGLMKPFSVGDNDIEINYILDRHLKIVQSMCDDFALGVPELTEDVYASSENSHDLPYTKFSNHDKPPKLHSAFKAKNETFLQYFQQDASSYSFGKEDDDEILFF